MEIEVTSIINVEDTEMLSNSVVNLGPNASAITWQNCMDAAELHCGDIIGQFDSLIDCRDEMIDHFKGYGAWTLDELETMSMHGLIAMLIQDIAAAHNELCNAMDEFEDSLDESDDDDYTNDEICEQLICKGEVSGRMYVSEGSYYFVMGD